MTWKDILKISTEDAISDAKRFAPEAVAEGERENLERKEMLRQSKIKEGLPKRKKQLQRYIDLMKDNPKFAKSELGEAIQMNIKLAKESLMKPKVFKLYIDSMKSILRTTTLGE